MKKLFYILFLFTVSLQAQKRIADTSFYYTYGGVNNDEARDIKETPDKGYILAGTTSSFGPGQSSFYLIKTDALGNHLWSSVQGGSQNDWAYTVQLTHDSGFFVAGYSNSFDPNTTHYYNAYYLKTDKNGQLLWQKSVLANGYTFIYGSCALPDSGFILCGQTYASNTYGGSDAYLIRVNKNGDTLWTHNYGGIQDEVFNSVCFINNKLYAVGSNSTHPTDTASDGWIVKLDMNGNQLQESFISFAAHYQENISGITPFDNKSFNICGSTYINDAVDTNLTKGILAKLDTSLNNLDTPQNIQAGASSSNSVGSYSKILNISHNNICIIGIRTGGLGGLGMYFISYDQTNTLLNFLNVPLYVAGGGNDDYGYSGIYTTGGKVIGVGKTLSYGAGAEDAFLVRFNSDSIYNSSINTFVQNNFTDTLYLAVASIKNYATNFNVKLFPNPSHGSVQLQITSIEQKPYYNAKVYSILGSEVYSSKVQANYSNILDFSFLENGSYFLKIEDSDSKIVSVLKFIINK